jgi:hypothetical protein
MVGVLAQNARRAIKKPELDAVKTHRDPNQTELANLIGSVRKKKQGL